MLARGPVVLPELRQLLSTLNHLVLSGILKRLFLIFDLKHKQTVRYIFFSARKYFANCVFLFYSLAFSVCQDGGFKLQVGFGCGHTGACGYICAHTCGLSLCTHVF